MTQRETLNRLIGLVTTIKQAKEAIAELDDELKEIPPGLYVVGDYAVKVAISKNGTLGHEVIKMQVPKCS